MFKKLLVVLLAIALVGCSSGSKDTQETPSASTDANPEVNLTFSITAVNGDAHHEAMKKFKEEVEAAGVNITVDTYDNGSLFKQDQELGAVQQGGKNGGADIVYLSASWLTDVSPWVSMFATGYMFKSYDHMTKVLNGEVGEEVFNRISEEQGILPLKAFYLGTRQISLGKDKEIKTPEDLNGVNLRMPNSESWIYLGKALGANPTPIAFSELYTALQSGAVDGQDNPLPTVNSAKFYEVQKSITLTNHLVDSVWPVINNDTWNSLTEDQKTAVNNAMEAARKTCDETNLAREAELVEFFKSEGLSVYEADVDAFAKHVLDIYLNDEAQSGTWDMDLYEKVQSAY
ncbi:MAG: sialic acid TRAP transporter substrate-binding protein SiaP [Anaerorhabdus sp.]